MTIALMNDMALFVEVVKAGSFRGAADNLRMPSSTLSRRISALEKAIGLRLLNRTTRKIELTEAGQLYFQRSKRIVDEARLAHEELGNMLTRPGGVIRASLPVALANTLLAPLIAEFADRYPAITFELDLTSRRVDLVAEPVDVAIRMGESPSSSLIVRQIARIPRYLYASPRYLDRAGEPSRPSELARHECLRLRPAEVDSWTLYRTGKTVDAAVGGRFVLNDVEMMQRLAVLGLGIAMLAEYLAVDDVARGRLRRILPGWQAKPISVSVITETRLLPAKTQLFVDFLRERLRRD